MPPRTISRTFTLASVLALGAGTAVAGPAAASPAGDEGVLTASNGTSTLSFASGATLSATETIREASWAPDGSRAIFVSGSGQVKTLRHEDGRAVVDMTLPNPNVRFGSPSYRGDGSGLVMAIRQPNALWKLAFQPSSSGWLPVPGSPSDGRHYLNPDAGPGGLVVYQTQPNGTDGQPTGTPSVGLYDPARVSATEDGFVDIIDDAANPSISPDGERVAFVREQDGIDQIFVADTDGGNLVQVTTDPVGHDNPVWSPTGSEIAFSRGSGEVATAAPDGSTAEEPRIVPGLSGVPAYQPRRTDHVFRLAGVNRIDTANAVSQHYWATVGSGADPQFQAQSVVLSRSDEFADALGGGPLAAAKKGPLLMTSPLDLDPAALAEIRRVIRPGGTVYLLGGTGAISATVESQVRAAGFSPRRIVGANRYETSVNIANEIDPTPSRVLAATAWDFPDALAAGAAAGSYNVPDISDSAVLVLTNDATLPTATRNYLNGLRGSAQLYAIGGLANTALGGYEPEPVIGRNRYETSQKVAYHFFGGSYHAGIATGTNWPDALAGGALMATVNGPLLLTAGDATTLSAPTANYLSEHAGSLSTGLIFGGTGAVVPALEAPLGNAISGPGGFELRTGATGSGTGRVSGVGGNPLGKRPPLGMDRPGTRAEADAARNRFRR